MADQVQYANQAAEPALLPKSVMEAQERGAALLSRANEVITNTARAVWECQAEMLRIETEQASRAMVPINLMDGSCTSIASYVEQWRDGSDQMIGRMRAVNDLMRACQWQLVQIYADSVVQDFGEAKSRRP